MANKYLWTDKHQTRCLQAWFLGDGIIDDFKLFFRSVYLNYLTFFCTMHMNYVHYKKKYFQSKQWLNKVSFKIKKVIRKQNLMTEQKTV